MKTALRNYLSVFGVARATPVRCCAAARGFSLVELLVVLAISGILIGIATTSIAALNNPLINATAQTLGYLKQARAKAISTTMAYTVTAASPTRFQARFGPLCTSGSLTTDPLMDIPLPRGASFTATNWSICFNARGLASTTQTLGLQDSQGHLKTVDVMLGGGVRTNDL